MKLLKDLYAEYQEDYIAEINQEFKFAGLPPIKLNYLALIMSGKPLPMSFDEYAECVVEAMDETSRIGFNHSKAQSKRAKKPRGKVGDDGESVSHLIGKLALSAEYKEESAKELWLRFLGELEVLLLRPKEIVHESGDFKKSAYEYDFKAEKRRKITFGQFAKVVSAFRTNKKLP